MADFEWREDDWPDDECWEPFEPDEGPPNDLIRRQRATERTLARYRPKVFDWRTGIHCVRLAHHHLRNMGHKPPALPRVRSPLGAKKALKANGWASVTEMLDELLPRIAPAAMLLGDLAVVPGQDGFDCILICADPHKMMGWHPDTGEFVLYDGGIGELTGAWRV